MTQKEIQSNLQNCVTCGKLFRRHLKKPNKKINCSMWCSSFSKSKTRYKELESKLSLLRNKSISIEVLSYPLIYLKKNLLHIRYESCQHEEYVNINDFLKRKKNICIHKECLHFRLWEFMYTNFKGELIPLTEPDNNRFLEHGKIKKQKVLIYHKPCKTSRIIQYGTLFGLNPEIACPICQANRIVQNNLDNYSKIFPKEWLENNEIIKMEALSKPILAKHKTCGHIRYLTGTAIKANPKYCENCLPSAPKAQIYWVEQFQKNNIPYKIIEHRNHISATLQCLSCTEIFEGSAYQVFHGAQRCICQSSHSKGEVAVKNVLEKMGLFFEMEVTFQECRDKHVLPFDFAVYKDLEKNEVNYLIEYEGIQHYKPVEIFGGEEALKKQIKRDKIKRDWALKSNIPLLEIPYTVPFEEIENTIYQFTKELI